MFLKYLHLRVIMGTDLEINFKMKVEEGVGVDHL
jgi:hypothetical protein